jgi:hypothetical protein
MDEDMTYLGKTRATPGDIDTPEGKAGEILLNKTVKWREEFYDMDPHDIKEILFGRAGGTENLKDNDASYIGVAYIEYSYREIGLTQDWFKVESARIGNKIVVRREILLQRLRGSSLSPYDRDDIDAIIDLALKPINEITVGKFFTLDIYEELNPNRIYIMSIDCSTGSGGDNNAITIIDPYTEKPCAELESPYIGEPTLVRIIIEIVTKYVPKAIVCIERNSVGSAIITFLMESVIAGRLYFDKYKEIAEENMKQAETTESMLKAAAKMKTYYGVYTENRSRDAMFSILADRIKDHKDQFVTQNITRDISKLVMKGGKVQAMVGWHDDSVMSYLIGMYVLKYGNNLSNFGFNRGDVVSDTLKEGGGLLAPDIIDMNSVPESTKAFITTEVTRQNAESYDDILRRSILEAQQQTRQLAKHGIIENTAYNFTPVSQEYENFDEMDDEIMGFLRGINNS